jgi:hypothetical protein
MLCCVCLTVCIRLTLLLLVLLQLETISGDKVPAKAIQNLMKMIFPLNVQWKWEAVAHGDDAFLIGFPSAEDLQR